MEKFLSASSAARRSLCCPSDSSGSLCLARLPDLHANRHICNSCPGGKYQPLQHRLRFSNMTIDSFSTQPQLLPLPNVGQVRVPSHTNINGVHRPTEYFQVVWVPVVYPTTPSSPHTTAHPQLRAPESSRVLTPSEAPALRSPQDSPAFSHHDFGPAMQSSPAARYQETPQTSPPQLREESPLSESATTPRQEQASPPPTRERRTVVVRFMEVAAHTAKCDECNRRNREGMIRCGACGWQCCRRCLNDRRGDRKHQSFTSMHAPGPSEEEDVAARALVDLGNTRSAPAPAPPRQRGGSRPATDSEGGRQPKRPRTSRGNSGVDDSDETLSLPPLSEASPDDEYGRGDIFGFPRGRRNPPRGARPADMAE